MFEVCGCDVGAKVYRKLFVRGAFQFTTSSPSLVGGAEHLFMAGEDGHYLCVPQHALAARGARGGSPGAAGQECEDHQV